MRKVVVFNRVTLDGVFAAPDGNVDWFVRDPEVDEAAHALMSPDTLLLGRATYEMLERAWRPALEDPGAPKQARQTAEELTRMDKLVFSRTLKKTDWEKTTRVSGDAPDRVRKLKQGSGGDLAIFGSGTVIDQLLPHGLIDEMLLVVTPVVLGAGSGMFPRDLRVGLEVLNSRAFASGNLLLHYRIPGAACDAPSAGA
ncbi:dihydrofolate reductase family protein [Micromonospora chersina]|uniref:dihydrofolate reductase family protein n=1 Tax=Micromonospora chersina TaxID=47854 RepID=UPI0033C88F01